MAVLIGQRQTMPTDWLTDRALWGHWGHKLISALTGNRLKGVSSCYTKLSANFAKVYEDFFARNRASVLPSYHTGALCIDIY